MTARMNRRLHWRPMSLGLASFGLATAFSLFVGSSLTVHAQSTTGQPAGAPAGGQAVNDQAATVAPTNANAQQTPAANRPFPPLSATDQQRLDQLLAAWEKQSQGTKTLTAHFVRWHFDPGAAPVGTPATISQGDIKYAAPDKGMFKVEPLKSFKGIVDNKPTYEIDPKNPGEYWVCNGAEIIEFDRAKKECNVQTLPPELRGQQIFQSPLPFVFNLDAKEIQERYWFREIAPPQGKTGVYVFEAWPKTQADRAQYKMVIIVMSQKTFLPEALVIYAPNYNAKTSQIYDHYEFSNPARNSMLDNLQNFTDTFIKARPGIGWKVIREPAFSGQQAALPPATQSR